MTDRHQDLAAMTPVVRNDTARDDYASSTAVKESYKFQDDPVRGVSAQTPAIQLSLEMANFTVELAGLSGHYSRME
jgi:hypothetical protein